MIKLFIKRNKGFTLVETLVAISIFTTSLLGIMSVITSSIADTKYIKSKMLATYLAQEGIEYVRNFRDNEVLYAPGNSDGWDHFSHSFNSCNNADDDNNACFIEMPPGSNFTISPCNNSNQKCELYLSDGGYVSESNGNTDSGFTRKIWVVPIFDSTDEFKIVSKVYWTQGSGGSVTFSENLYNWITL